LAVQKGEKRGERNRTIVLGDVEIRRYAGLCPHAYLSGQTENVIVHGDVFKILETPPPAFVDLLIADPPYNLDKTYASHVFKRVADEEYTRFTRSWIELIRPVLKPNASIYVCSDWRTSLVVGGILEECFTLQNRISWQREKGRGAGRNWKNAMEDIWFATNSPKDYTFNAGAVKMRRRVIAPYRVGGAPKDWVESDDGNFRDTSPSNFWDDISIPFWSKPENTDHPTQKPEKLFAKLILASSNPGDMVFDPFLGAGTTAVTAKKLGRRYSGIEREETYCAYAQKRLEMADETPEIQGYAGGVFWERNTLAYQQRTKEKRGETQNI